MMDTAIVHKSKKDLLRWHGHLRDGVSWDDAVRSLQRHTGVKVDGDYGQKTEIAQTHRWCGCPDIADAGALRRWAHKNIAFWHDMAIGGVDVRQVVADAIKAWNDVSGLDMAEVARISECDIFAHYRRIDGRNRTLAWSYLPSPDQRHGTTQLEQRYDSSEDWAGSDWRLLSTMIHELGHAVGLSHSESPSAIMYYSINGTRAPASDDIRQIQKRYGKPTTDPDPPPSSGTTITVAGDPLGPGTYDIKKNSRIVTFRPVAASPRMVPLEDHQTLAWY